MRETCIPTVVSFMATNWRHYPYWHRIKIHEFIIKKKKKLFEETSIFQSSLQRATKFRPHVLAEVGTRVGVAEGWGFGGCRRKSIEKWSRILAFLYPAFIFMRAYAK